MPIERTTCPHCGSGDVEALLPSRPSEDEVFAGVPSALRHCLVCGVRWELDDIDLTERLA